MENYHLFTICQPQFPLFLAKMWQGLRSSMSLFEWLVFLVEPGLFLQSQLSNSYLLSLEERSPATL